jgi:Protein of unknown function (DUF4232)
MKQQIWQMLAVTMAGCALAGCATAASSTRAEKPARAHMAAPLAGSRAAWCKPGVLTLAYGPRLSPMTGEHGVFYELINHGRLACALAGYPHIRLYAGGEALPFRYIFGGGPYVTGKPPATVTVNPGGVAWILVAKYRCDQGTLRDATTISLTLPGMAGAALAGPVSRDGGGVSTLSYCRGGAADPGQTVAVSPVEPAPGAASYSA